MSIYLGNNLIAPNQSNAANKSLSNLNSDGEKHFLNKSQVSNCILEAPNGVYSVSGRSLTFKDGLKVLIPDGRNADGTLNNYELTLDTDYTVNYSVFNDGQYRTAFLKYDDYVLSLSAIYNTYLLGPYEKFSDMPTATPTTTNYAYCRETNYWYQRTVAEPQWTTMRAIPLISYLTITDGLTITDSKQPVQLVDTDMADGQWVSKVSRLANGTTIPTSTNITYDLSSYLPNDGYIYEVCATGSVTSGSTSGNYAGINLQSDISSDMYLCYARTRASGTVISAGTLIIPVGNARTLTVFANSSFVGTFNLWVKGYRRIGTNI